MFRKKRKGKETVCYFPVDGGILEMNQATYDYIRKLTCTINDLQAELKAIKPILEDPGLKPAVSSACDNCKFAVFSPTIHIRGITIEPDKPTILGCRRHALCSYYMPSEEEEE